MVKIKRALISVSDKTGIVEFAQGLVRHGVEILSTGGTAKALKTAGVAVKDVSEFTGFPEMMDGRVKTLHPRVHGGLLALRDNPEHMRQAQEHGIGMIDMVVVNLYPFARTVAKPGVHLEEAIENIDIGGPSMIRSASKNFRSVAVVVRPERYPALIAEMDANQGQIAEATRHQLAIEAFDQTAEYDAGIHRYLLNELGETNGANFPATIRFTFEKKQDLRYGENPHQLAAFYHQTSGTSGPETSVAMAKQLHGKELSFNNIVDIQAALELVVDFEQPAACIVKHTNPCGMATAETISEAYRKAFHADPVSAYGGIVGLNRPCTLEIAELMKDVFLECVIAPSFAPAALELLMTRKNIRLLETGPFTPAVARGRDWQLMDLKRVSGGLLLQEWDHAVVKAADLKLVTRKAPTDDQIEDLLFAWRVCKHVKSNAIVVAKNGLTLGIGPGQTNRVGAVEIALRNAGDQARGALLASDAFFPFPDNIEVAAKAGIAAIIQPGGSVHDPEVIAAADQHGLVMVFTGIRHFNH